MSEFGRQDASSAMLSESYVSHFNHIHRDLPVIQATRCPVCSKTLDGISVQHRLFPFCSDRCRKIDLARWADGRYAIVEELSPEQVQVKMLEEQGIDPTDIA